MTSIDELVNTRVNDSTCPRQILGKQNLNINNKKHTMS